MSEHCFHIFYSKITLIHSFVYVLFVSAHDILNREFYMCILTKNLCIVIGINDETVEGRLSFT
jgi:hypothetical protein